MRFLKIFISFVMLCHALGMTMPSSMDLYANDIEYSEIKAGFENFIRCELTRTTAKNFFKGKTFTITMVNLFDLKKEGDIIIVSGAVECWVEDRHRTLFAAVGVKEIFDKKKVSYLVIRKKDFTILATELINYPYKERCGWSQYRVDIN